MSVEMGPHVEVLLDGQGLKAIRWNKGCSSEFSETLVDRGEVAVDAYITHISVEHMLKVLRKAGIWSVVLQTNKPGD